MKRISVLRPYRAAVKARRFPPVSDSRWNTHSTSRRKADCQSRNHPLHRRLHPAATPKMTATTPRLRLGGQQWCTRREHPPNQRWPKAGLQKSTSLAAGTYSFCFCCERSRGQCSVFNVWFSVFSFQRGETAVARAACCMRGPTLADKPPLAPARLTVPLTLKEGLVLHIFAIFRKKVFSPHDIPPRNGGEDVGNHNPPFLLAGKWPSSAAKRPSCAAKCSSWGAKWLSSWAFKDLALADPRRICRTGNGLRQWCSHRRFLQPRQVQQLYLQTASRVAQNTSFKTPSQFHQR